MRNAYEMSEPRSHVRLVESPLTTRCQATCDHNGITYGCTRGWQHSGAHEWPRWIVTSQAAMYDRDDDREELTADELRRLRDVMEHEPQTFDTRALVMKLQRMAVQP